MEEKWGGGGDMASYCPDLAFYLCIWITSDQITTGFSKRDNFYCNLPHVLYAHGVRSLKHSLHIVYASLKA